MDTVTGTREPPGRPATVAVSARARELLRGPGVVVLSGAGMSTDSGIPDYRGPGSPRGTPMTFGEFLSAHDAQRRYWARSHLGWRRMTAARPNPGHDALALMERQGRVAAVITQNVDGLHQAAGSQVVVDLHGRLSDVVCMSCHDRSSRLTLHHRLEALNPGFGVGVDAAPAPDGDVLLEQVGDFRLAGCRRCDGPLKPDVVFFGENVPRGRVARCEALVDHARVLLVTGSSLTVMSGLRFVRRAHRAGTPVVIVNRGPTRGDALATVTVAGGCSEVLGQLAATDSSTRYSSTR